MTDQNISKAGGVAKARGDNPSKKFKHQSEEEDHLAQQQTDSSSTPATTVGADHSGSGDAQLQSSDEVDQNQAGQTVPLSRLMNQLSSEMKMLHEAWIPVFLDSENAEQVCLNQLDSLLKQAKEYEQSLVRQKEQLRERLKILSQTLKMT